jgi:YegS/Rv2252/BmrU family lipid kinase
VNPAAGPRRVRVAQRELARAERALAARGAEGTVRLTEGPGHAQELARAAVAARATLVCAWGGDGTVNEVARAVAGTGTALGIVPAGSGNGLARELGLPWDPVAALGVALGRRERVIDVGDVEGRLFVNLAGIGLDAHVAERFNARHRGRRGHWPYLAIGTREIFRYRARTYTLRVGGETWREEALAIVCANARQYGGGAVVAPTARPDDGHLDLVVVAPRPPLQALRDSLHLFRGTLDRAPGVRTARTPAVEIAGPEPILFHVDGEPVTGGPVVTVRVRPAVLRVRVP